MLTLIVGGARSGKSRYAEALVRSLGGDAVTYVATLAAADASMRRRVARHRARRPPAWRTVEATGGADAGACVATALREAVTPVVLIDCLSGLISTALLEREADGEERAVAAALARCDTLLAACLAADAEVVIVSNEVGAGVVPTSALGRWFRDALGLANQRVAARAERVLTLTVGIPTALKGELPEVAA